jgi:hypothetical protein
MTVTSPANLRFEMLQCFVFALLLTAATAQAATVWDGPLTSFTEPPGGVGSDPANQDRLTADVFITRDPTRGLYNAFSEVTYTHYSSPAATEWAFGNLASYTSLTYTNWEGMFGGSGGGGPPSTLNRPTVLHLINDDIYLQVTMMTWGMGGTGGFSYERTTPHAVSPIPLQITRGPNQVVLTWTNAAFNLQSATNVTGPYATISGATSPYTNSISNQKLFFRLIN